MSDKHTIKSLCAVLEVSRSGYYQLQDVGESARARQTLLIKSKITEVYAASRQTYGSPRVTAALRAEGQAVSINQVARLMREQGLQGRQKRRYRVRTTDSRHDQPIAPNLLAVAPTPIKANEIWVTDITYVETSEGWLYLAGVLDLYSRRLIGWAMGSSLETALPLAALPMALRQRRPASGVLHHSGSWLSVCERPVSAVLGRPRLRRLHEPQGQLLRQRFHGVVLEHAQTRAALPLQLDHPCSSHHRHLRSHQGLL